MSTIGHKVSILIPCYNAEKYLEETLYSCVNQDYANIEIIVVDDGSTDKSYEIARKWANRFDTIKIYSQPNSGVCKARNLAFEKSSGDFILYLDADDLISSDLVSSQIKTINNCQDNSVSICSWGRFYSSIKDFKLEKQTVYKDYDNPINLIEDLLNGGMLGLSCYLTPRYIIKKAGPWNEKLTINTDGEFFIRVIANSGSIKFSEKGILYYRSNNPNSISRRKPSEGKGESLLLSYKLIYNYLKTYNKLTSRIEIGIKKEILSTAYQYNIYNKIVEEAKLSAKEISRKNTIPNTGSIYFKALCYLFGFWNIINIKKFLKI